MSSMQRLTKLNRLLLNNPTISLPRNNLKSQLYNIFARSCSYKKYTESKPNRAITQSFTDKQKFKNFKVVEEESFKTVPEISRHLINKDDPDIFGTITTRIHTEKFDHDEGDKEEHEYSLERRKGLRTKQYADIIKDHLNNKRIKEALDVLEIKMLKEDRVKPENYIYNLLIGGCARVGYTKKAFKLYNDMKKRDLKVTGGTYTSLFNACANSPWPEDGLNRARGLRELMFEKGYIANITNYNAMIKAFGRCGDLKTAFMLVDEMIDQKLTVTMGTINFLLQACISDKETGFRYAILTWQKIWQLKNKPNTYSFNLMLRCVRDCGLGELETAQNFFEGLPKQKIATESSNVMQPSLDAPKEKTTTSTTSSALQIINNTEFAPNLLSKSPHMGSVVAIRDVTKPEHRLLLIGGASGFLKQMYESKAVPDIKTYTQLLQILPPTIDAEKALLKMMKKTGDKVDTGFFNMLMKRRCLRFDYDSARNVLSMIKTADLKPDLITYGILAMTCETKFQARDMLDDMSDMGLRPNAEILGALLHQACSKTSFGYAMLVMNTILEEDIQPNSAFYKCIDDFYKKCQKNNSLLLNGESCKELKKINNDYFFKMFDVFSKNYENWYHQVNIKFPKVENHPWEQFTKSSEDGFEDRKIFIPKRKTKKRFVRAIL